MEQLVLGLAMVQSKDLSEDLAQPPELLHLYLTLRPLLGSSQLSRNVPFPEPCLSPTATLLPSTATSPGSAFLAAGMKP